MFTLDGQQKAWWVEMVRDLEINRSRFHAVFQVSMILFGLSLHFIKWNCPKHSCFFTAPMASTQMNRQWDNLSLSTVNSFMKLRLIAHEGWVCTINAGLSFHMSSTLVLNLTSLNWTCLHTFERVWHETVWSFTARFRTVCTWYFKYSQLEGKHGLSLSNTLDAPDYMCITNLCFHVHFIFHGLVCCAYIHTHTHRCLLGLSVSHIHIYLFHHRTQSFENAPSELVQDWLLRFHWAFGSSQEGAQRLALSCLLWFLFY